ncbi:MAG: glycosyltransferase family 4 protein [Promethearchaeota archaeon]
MHFIRRFGGAQTDKTPIAPEKSERMSSNFANRRYTSDKLRILVLGLRGIPEVQGGIERHCQELYPRLIKINCEITILARKGYVKKSTYEYRGIKIIPLWAPKQERLETVCHTLHGILWAAGHRKDFDVLHIHGIGPALFAYLARILGFILIITHHGPDYKRQKWGIFARLVLRIGERVGIHNAHAIIAISKYTQSLIKNKYGAYTTYIPNGVTQQASVPSGQTLDKFKLYAGRYFLAVGRLVPEKGFSDLLEAYKSITTDWKLAIVGEADHRSKYSKLLKQNSERVEGVVLTGFQTGRALQELYSNAGLFVLPSYHEGLPIVALEAMSYNLPILVSDITPNKEFVSPEETYPVGDVNVLSQKLRSFLKKPSFRNSSRLRSQKLMYMQTEFNWDIIAEKTAKLYHATACKLETRLEDLK